MSDRYRRTILVEYSAQDVAFTVERWLLNIGGPHESVERIAFAWNTPGESERIVMLDQKAAGRIADELVAFALAEP